MNDDLLDDFLISSSDDHGNKSDESAQDKSTNVSYLKRHLT